MTKGTRNLFSRSTLLLTLLLTLIPATAFAGVTLIPILGVTISAPGTTLVERPAPQQIEVVTQGLQSSGSLDEATLTVDENLRLTIDETTMTIAGEVNGQIQGLDADTPMRLDGTITGHATCVGAPPTPCETLQLDILVNGILLGGPGRDRLYELEQTLTATLTSSNGQPPVVAWSQNGNKLALRAEQAPS